jgi:hypothetical protein
VLALLSDLCDNKGMKNATQTIKTAKALAKFAIECAENPEQLEAAKNRLADVELCEQYFTNPDFKAALESYVFALNS